MSDESNGIVDFIRSHTSFLVTSHSRPDGDSLGSSIALGLALKQIGKEVSVVQADHVPHDFRWLPGVELVEHKDEAGDGIECAIILECNDVARTGLKTLATDHVINIDHHTNTDPFGDLNWVDDSAAAVAEIVLRLIRLLGAEVTPAIATNLYVAIVTDTGSFRFSNTTSQTFQAASELVALGARPAVVSQALFMTQPESRLRLLVAVLSTLQVDAEGGGVAWIRLTRDMLDETGATRDQTEGLVNYPLSIEGVKVAAFFREEGPTTTRISLRSSDGLDVAQVARRWNGGGHKNAAGLTIEDALPDAIEQLLGVLRQALA